MDFFYDHYNFKAWRLDFQWRDWNISGFNEDIFFSLMNVSWECLRDDECEWIVLGDGYDF